MIDQRTLLMFVFILLLGNKVHAAISCYSCDQMNVLNGTCNLGERIQQCNIEYGWCIKKWNNTHGVSNVQMPLFLC